MKVIFNFTTGEKTLDIELLDNPFTQEWSNRFVGTGITVTSNYYNLLWVKKWNPTYITECLEKLHKLTAELDSFGLTYKNIMPATIDEIDRAWANDLHRYFTHTLWDVDAQQSNFGNKYIYVRNLLHDVNTWIHEIEDHYPRNTKDLPVTNIDQIYMKSDPCYTVDGYSWEAGRSMNDWNWTFPEKYREYHSSKHADVIMAPQIQGKALIQSYLDGDNPNDRDVTGHYVTTGSLLIMTSDTREQIYQSTAFKSWLIKWGVDPDQAWYDFPIGNLKNKDDLMDIINSLSVDHTQGINHVLTSYSL